MNKASAPGRIPEYIENKSRTHLIAFEKFKKTGIWNSECNISQICKCSLDESIWESPSKLFIEWTGF